MTIADGMKWFKTSFGKQIGEALAGTPFSLDLLTAIAVQESYECWGGIYKSRSVPDVLKLCVGDIIDAPGRGTFPQTKAALLAAPHGAEIFAVARQALEDVGTVNPTYQKYAAANPNKYCHGFGIFQYDIQFCKGNPNFFLQKRWYDFGACLAQGLEELRGALAGTYGAGKTGPLTDDESVYVAIAYNAGPKHTHVGGGYKQGHEDDGVFYGEHIASYLEQAHKISSPAG